MWSLLTGSTYCIVTVHVQCRSIRFSSRQVSKTTIDRPNVVKYSVEGGKVGREVSTIIQAGSISDFEQLL